MKRICCSGPWHRPLVGARGAAAGQEKVFTYIRILTGLTVLGGGARGAGGGNSKPLTVTLGGKRKSSAPESGSEAGGHL